MPQPMRRFARFVCEHGLASSLAVAAVLRVVAAWCSYGFFTRDDYQLGIEQAYAWLHHTGSVFQYDFRSPLMTWGCMPFLALGELCGITDRAHLVQCMYLGWGMFSLLALPPVYAVAKRAFGDAVAAIAAWLMAGYAIMPAISCRAMIEVVAIVPLAWAMLYIDRARQADLAPRARFFEAFKGALALSIATLVRFQLGLLFLAVAWVLRRAGRRAWLGLVAGAALGVALQALCDIGFGRMPLATPWAYLQFNLTYAASFGTSPWYTYVLNLALMTVPPATLVLLQPMWRAMQRQPWLSAILVVFVGVHSFVGHKEDRFMFSVLPMFFIILAAALYESWHGKRWQRAGVWTFTVVNAVALVVAIGSDTYRSVNEPLVYLSRHAPNAHLASVGFPSVPTYYLGDTAKLHMYGSVLDLRQASPQALAQLDYVWLRGGELQYLADIATLTDQRCSEVTWFPGDLADRIVVRVNQHNARRGPTALVRCAPAAPSPAAPSPA